MQFPKHERSKKPPVKTITSQFNAMNAIWNWQWWLAFSIMGPWVNCLEIQSSVCSWFFFFKLGCLLQGRTWTFKTHGDVFQWAVGQNLHSETLHSSNWLFPPNTKENCKNNQGAKITSFSGTLELPVTDSSLSGENAVVVLWK